MPNTFANWKYMPVQLHLHPTINSQHQAMARRMTIGARPEVGLLSNPSVLEPLPTRAYAKSDFWNRPSRWQICLPRLRTLAKSIMSIVLFVLVLRTLYQEKSAAGRHLAEAENLEAVKRNNWLWKDFPLYVLSGDSGVPHHLRS